MDSEIRTSNSLTITRSTLSAPTIGNYSGNTCSGTTTVSASTPGADYYIWTPSSGIFVNGYSNYSGSGSVTISGANRTGGSFSVQGYSNACQAASPSSTKNIYFGTPTIYDPTANGAYPQYPNYINSSGAFLVVQMKGGTGTTWQQDGGSGTIYPNGNSANAYTSNFLRVRATAYNDCGNGDSFTFYLQNSSSGGYGYRLSAPSGSNKLTVTFDYKEQAEGLLDYVALYNDKADMLTSFSKKDQSKEYFKYENSVNLDISKVKNGIYFLHVKLGDKLNKQQIEIVR